MSAPDLTGIEPRTAGTQGPVVHLHLKVIPGASREAIVGPHAGRIKVRTSAPPEKGRANRMVLGLLAKQLDVPTRSLRILRGRTDPLKTIEVVGIDAATVAARLYS